MNDLQSKIAALASPELSCNQIASLLGCSSTAVRRCVDQFGLFVKMRARPAQRSNLTEMILVLADGIKTSDEIAKTLGCSAKHVQNVIRMNGAASLPRGARPGDLNPSYKAGRKIDLDGYVLVSASPDHPYARARANRNYKMIYEHRLVMEHELGRYLLPEEIVDHIDGLHLHNHPSNLRLFASNADHLRATITGFVPEWSAEGWANMHTPKSQRTHLQRVDTYGRRKKSGVVRLRQILRAALQLGIDSPYLLGTHHHLEKAQIDYSSPTMIERALADLLKI